MSSRIAAWGQPPVSMAWVAGLMGGVGLGKGRRGTDLDAVGGQGVVAG